jgi:hypothetical protein
MFCWIGWDSNLPPDLPKTASSKKRKRGYLRIGLSKNDQPVPASAWFRRFLVIVGTVWPFFATQISINNESDLYRWQKQATGSQETRVEVCKFEIWRCVAGFCHANILDWLKQRIGFIKVAKISHEVPRNELEMRRPSLS